VKHAVVIDAGQQVDTFHLGYTRAGIWDGAGRLWLLEAEGTLHRVSREERGWSTTAVAPRPDTTCLCEPGDDERLWVWALPRGYSDYYLAQREASRVVATATGRHTAGWVTRDKRGHFRACWGGYTERQGLTAIHPTAPVPGARAEHIPVSRSTFLGPLAHFRVGGMDGEASLRQVLVGETLATELWWRYDGPGGWVRLAGPWTPRVDTR